MPLPWLTMFTYPMKYLCILGKYISRPLLLSQSGPCSHIVSEMYLQPSRPRMHANSVSRENWRFLWQVLASCLTRLSDFCCFFAITEPCKPGEKQFHFCYLTKEFCWSEVELFKNSASNESFIKCNIASDLYNNNNNNIQYLLSAHSQWSKSALHNKNNNKILNLQNYIVIL